MTNITIKDTGYVKVNGSGTVFSGTDIANSGTALTLKGVSVDYDLTAGVDTSNTPNNTGFSVVNPVSYENAKIVIQGILKRGSLTGSGTDLADLEHIQNFVKTKGVKCVYYNDSVTDTSGYPFITKFLGLTDAYTNHPSEKHFHVRFTRFSVKQSAGEGAHYFILEGVLTA